MEFFRRAWATIQGQLGKLPASSKWLIGSLMIILLMVGFLTLQYAAQPELAPLMPAAADRAPAILARLQAAGIKAQTQAGQIMVSSEKRNDAYAVLAEGDLLSSNTAAAFDEMIARQSPWTTKDQNAQAFLLAKQKVLSQIIAKMVNVRAADVILATPEDKGFGATHRRPSGSVNVLMKGSNVINKKLVEAIAGLVAGAMAEMKPEDVVVIDANQGRQYTVKKQDGTALPNDVIESLQALEQYHREKIVEVLGYIPGVIVAVNVRTDPVLRKDEVLTKYGPEPLKSEENEENETRDATGGGGEAGVRPNVGLSIDNTGGAASTSKTNKSRTEYADTKIVSQTTQQSAGGMPKQISVTVNVPRSFFVSIFKQGKPADTPEPDDAAIEAIKTAQLAQIEAQVKPLISTESAGVVTVHMIPDARALAIAAGAMPGSASSGSNVLVSLDNGWIKPAGLSLLALASLGLMFGMVRKATQQTPMPTVQELAGVPPVLSTDEDLIGEADTSETTMAGVELNEDEIRTRKIAEQIAEMVKSSPAEAAGIFGRWIRKEG